MATILLDAEQLPTPADLTVLLGVAKAGAYGFDRNPDRDPALDRLLAKQLVRESVKGRVFLTQTGEKACIALTGSCPDEEEPEDMSPFILGPSHA